jgi:hypothetical protein
MSEIGDLPTEGIPVASSMAAAEVIKVNLALHNVLQVRSILGPDGSTWDFVYGKEHEIATLALTALEGWRQEVVYDDRLAEGLTIAVPTETDLILLRDMMMNLIVMKV